MHKSITETREGRGQVVMRIKMYTDTTWVRCDMVGPILGLTHPTGTLTLKWSLHLHVVHLYFAQINDKLS